MSAFGCETMPDMKWILSIMEHVKVYQCLLHSLILALFAFQFV